MKCFYWSVALYAAEACTLTRTDRRIEAFEIWTWRIWMLMSLDREESHSLVLISKTNFLTFEDF